MIPMVPHKFETGETLNPARLNGNFRALADDLKIATDRRYGHSFAVFDFGGLTHSSGAGFQTFSVQVPTGYQIDVEGVEAYFWAADSEAYTVTLGGDVTGGRTLDVTGKGATVLAWNADTFDAKLTAGQTLTVSFSGPATFTVTRAFVVVYFRHNRFNGQPPSEYEGLELDGTSTDDATPLNNALADYATDVAAEGDAAEILRLVVFCMTKEFATPTNLNHTFRVPAIGARVISADFGVCADSGTESVQFDLDNEAAALQLTATVVGGGSGAMTTDLGNSVNSTQAQDDSDDSADDWTLQLQGAGSADIYRAYAALWLGE